MDMDEAKKSQLKRLIDELSMLIADEPEAASEEMPKEEASEMMQKAMEPMEEMGEMAEKVGDLSKEMPEEDFEDYKKQFMRQGSSMPLSKGTAVIMKMQSKSPRGRKKKMRM